MSKALLELKAMNLENRNEATAAEIAEHMGKDTDLDHRVAGLSTQRFTEIIKAYRKRIEKEAREDKAEYNAAYKDKTFSDATDHYIVLSSINEILIEALPYSFRMPNEKSCHERAMKAKADLLLCLAEMGSPHIETLSGIVIEETEEITLDEFIDSKRAATMDVFLSCQKVKPSSDRFDRIFSKIKKTVKTIHGDFRRRNTGAIRKGGRTLTTEDMQNMCRTQQRKDGKGYGDALVYRMTGRKIHGMKLKEIDFLTRMNKILPKK